MRAARGGTAVRGVWAAVPVKEFAGAKQRLAPLLNEARRRELARAMLDDVLSALSAAPLAGILLNSVEPEATALARRYGARVTTTEARAGHTRAVMAMAALLKAEGIGAMLTCPGDIPAVTAAEIGAVIAAHPPGPGFTIVPAHDRRGSNTILMTPPDLIALRFGDDSFLPHLEAARQQGFPPTIVEQPGIARDLDGPEDVRAFLRSDLGRATRARALLEDWLSA